MHRPSIKMCNAFALPQKLADDFNLRTIRTYPLYLLFVNIYLASFFCILSHSRIRNPELLLLNKFLSQYEIANLFHNIKFESIEGITSLRYFNNSI